MRRRAALAALVFPRDQGAHPQSRIEWWYATGWLGSEAAPQLGFQITFFRSRTGLAANEPGRFAARQLLFAHAAVTDLGARRHLHAQRIARWNGDGASALAAASVRDIDLRLGGWSLRRGADGRIEARAADAGFAFTLAFTPTQPPLLQGEGGRSRKGPEVDAASLYVSEPQLAAAGSVTIAGQSLEARGRAWLDHEWSEHILSADAVGWDWVGINLFDGSALTAFRLRRADGSALWAGGSWRAAGAPARSFAPQGVAFEPRRLWASPATGARYPVEWTIETPAGRFGLRALLDAQELDSRASTGSIYWEGLCELRDAGAHRIGLGYLEMTGYAGRLQIA